MLKSIAITALALTLAGCATQAEQACSNGTPMEGQSLEQTCAIGQMDRARINGEVLTGLAVAAVGVGTAAVVVEATRPVYPQQTVIIAR